jgi:hypothetical protein
MESIINGSSPAFDDVDGADATSSSLEKTLQERISPNARNANGRVVWAGRMDMHHTERSKLRCS